MTVVGDTGFALMGRDDVADRGGCEPDDAVVLVPRGGDFEDLMAQRAGDELLADVGIYYHEDCRFGCHDMAAY